MLRNGNFNLFTKWNRILDYLSFKTALVNSQTSIKLNFDLLKINDLSLGSYGEPVYSIDFNMTVTFYQHLFYLAHFTCGWELFHSGFDLGWEFQQMK